MKRALIAMLAFAPALLFAACGGSGGRNVEAISGAVYSGDNETMAAATSPIASLEDAVPVYEDAVYEDVVYEDAIYKDAAELVVGNGDGKTFGDVIEFDDLEIKFGNGIVWSSVNNQFSDYYGSDVFLVPVEIKNVKDMTHGLNMFYYTQYGSKGTNLDNVGHYFANEAGSAGNMRPGATKEAFMAFLYDGDGDYYVEFSKLFGGAVEARLPIKWADNSASPMSDLPAISSASTAEHVAPADIKTFGDVVEFDDLEITFIDDVAWSTIDNEFSDINGAVVFFAPIVVKNMKNETHGLSLFYYTQYGSKGTGLDNVGFYFDGEVAFAGDMRPGATQETFMSFLYDGDGDYYVEFSELFGDTVEVKLPIKKSQ